MEVLNDPMFEHSQPSWIRSSLRKSKKYTVKVAGGDGDGENRRVGDDVGNEEEAVDWGEFEVETEFVSQKEKEPARVRPVQYCSVLKCIF